MSNQGQAQEPTMEEILACIRRIISEDSGSEETPQESAEAAPPPPPAATEFAEEPAEEEVAEEDDILELTEALPEETYEEPAPEPVAPAATYMPEPALAPELMDDIQFAEPEPEPEPVREPEPEPEPVYEPIPETEPEVAPALATGVAPQPEPVDEAADTDIEEPAMSADQSPILSRDAETAASAAFGALASSLSSSNGGRTLE